MVSAFEKYKTDIARLADEGLSLSLSLHREYDATDFAKLNLSEAELKKLKDVRSNYQKWYSESISLISQLLPSRLADFKAYYTPAANRKEITVANYTLSDYLRGLSMSRGSEVFVAPKHAFLPMYQQYQIVDGLRNRFESIIYDIKTVLHADILDDEIDAAQELNKRGFQRAAGALSGVVLEGHLKLVCEQHNVLPSKKTASISDFNESLKSNDIIDITTWRFIQYLADIRNNCDHKKDKDPTVDEVTSLIEGTKRITKTVF